MCEFSFDEEPAELSVEFAYLAIVACVIQADVDLYFLVDAHDSNTFGYWLIVITLLSEF